VGGSLESSAQPAQPQTPQKSLRIDLVKVPECGDLHPDPTQD
jgi:hypothetical protein